MQIHRVRGRDLRDALEKARAAHGESAVVLSHEATPGGGVTVSVTAEDLRAGGEPAAPAPSTAPSPPAAEPGELDVDRRLREAGASEHLTRAILEDLRESGAQGAFAIDRAATAIAERMRVASSPRPSGAARVIAFVGPSGAGKTATVAKLADRLTRAGRKVAVATLDSYRPGGVDVLRVEADRLGVPFYACRYREDLATLVSEQGDRDVILLDTRGRSPKDTEHLSQLASVLLESLAGATGADLLTYLVVPATASTETLAEVREGFARTRPSAGVVTKVDETRRTAVAIESLLGAELPLAFVCTGQEVTTDLYRATPDRLADLILGGRVR